MIHVTFTHKFVGGILHCTTYYNRPTFIRWLLWHHERKHFIQNL